MAGTTESKGAIHVVVHNGLITFVGADCTDLAGHPPDYFHGRHVHELVHPDDRVRLDRTFVPGWTGRFTEHFRVQEASGDWTWRRADGVRTMDASGPHTVMELRTIDGPPPD